MNKKVIRPRFIFVGKKLCRLEWFLGEVELGENAMGENLLGERPSLVETFKSKLRIREGLL